MSSPRISFSQSLPADHPPSDRSPRVDPPPPPPSDFNFSISPQIPAAHSSDAAELFSNGKILPFFKTPVRSDPRPSKQTADSSAGSGEENASPAVRRPFWRFGRSSSVGSAAEPGPSLASPLNRCKSTGSFPNPARRKPQAAAATVGILKLRSDSSRRKTYYFSGSRRGGCLNEGGVRIGPILNVPAPIFGAGGSNGGDGGGSNGAIGGIFAYLLCSCGGEAKRDEMRLSGTGIV